MRRISHLLLFLFIFIAFVPAQKKPVTVEDVWLYYRFVPGYPQAFNWMEDDSWYSVMEDSKLIKKSIEGDEEKVILDTKNLKSGSGEALKVQDYTFAKGENKVMLKTEVEQIYRRSTKEVVMVYDLASGKMTTLHDGDQVSFATFSPDGSKVAYMAGNNLWFTDLASGKEYQVTKDGKINSIIYGGTDWVYEEEFAFTKAFFWSPDSKKLAYYRFDESKVKEFSMDMYGQLYPEQYRFKYPKAGEANSEIEIHIFHIAEKKDVKVDIGTEKDIYIPRATWTKSADKLALMRMNRLQNKLDVLLVDASTGKAEKILTETSETYVTEVTDKKWHFLENGNQFLWQSEAGGYNHLYLYDLQGNLVKQVTSGDWEVTDIAAIDEKNGDIYFMATAESPLERHLYKTNLKGKSPQKLTEKAGTHEVSFSSDYSYYLDTWSDVKTPPVTALYRTNGEQVMVLEDNAKFSQALGQYEISEPEFFDFKTSEGVELNGWMIKPVDFDPAKKYPVLMFVYGGPGSQTAADEFGYFNYMWYQALANKGYMVVSVDGRGTGGRGAEFKKLTYGQLGKLETIDQIETAKYLGSLPYVDKDRIGIWGWSFGGYLTSLAMTKGAEFFKMGIAVAPVTNWRYYDTIYTERYLKTPQLNPEGYDDNSPIHFASKLRGNYLLIHGTADDNVHFQNSLEWVDALINANKQFDTFFYPNKNHGIYGGLTRYHLYKKMTDFIEENL